MVRAGETNENSLLCHSVSGPSVVVARIYSMSVVQTSADRVSLNNLVAHGIPYKAYKVEMD